MSQNTLAGVPQAQARAEYEKATAGLGFTKDYLTFDAIIEDRMASAGERVYAWIRRRAWGNYRLYAANKDGTPAYQRDCGKDTGLHKETVSSTVKYLVARGYVRTDGKVLYPTLTPAPYPIEKSQIVSRSTDFLDFMEHWKVSRATDFQELELARATVERLRKVQRADYKVYVALRTNGGPTLYESERVIESEDSPPPQPFSHSPEKADEEEPTPPIVDQQTPAPSDEIAQQDVSALPAVAPPADYETFTSLYPKTHLDGSKTKRVFNALPHAHRVLAIHRLPIFLQSERWQDGQYIPLASNWLSREEYLADPPPLIRLAAGSTSADKLKADMGVTMSALRFLKGES